MAAYGTSDAPAMRQKGDSMSVVKSPAPNLWAVYTGKDGELEYVSLADVIGVKYPDPETKLVSLRMSNGTFVPVKDSIGKVLDDLRAIN